MKTSIYKAWWREMGAISRGMMFIEGTIATPTALDRTEQDRRARAPVSPPPAPEPEGRPASLRGSRQKAFSLYEDLLFLGGRPMTAGHNGDLDEPFPQTFADPKYRTHRFGEHRRPTAQPQHCATC